jgi:hypothetical protein
VRETRARRRVFIKPPGPRYIPASQARPPDDCNTYGPNPAPCFRHGTLGKRRLSTSSVNSSPPYLTTCAPFFSSPSTNSPNPAAGIVDGATRSVGRRSARRVLALADS